ncbi:MAG: phospholipid carrier-dependent glycosyltransferase [Cyanobacteria bacterium RM1_2_2]|nr:phospholipid carrier-dependent glycosyltransferase [Cyanobacteria bacterium RM1_2_2]
MAGIFCFSLGLRFWGLSRFNTLVFDEVYYAKFASAFLKGEIIFTGHPPLSTYIVAIGIWLGNQMPWGNADPKNSLTGLLLSPFSYRWLNAFTGSLIPVLVGAIAYQLLHRRSFALIAALLLALDGLFLVESRYALNNIYLVLLGLLGHLFFLLALQTTSWKCWLHLILSGIGFGGAAAIKWNGMGFLLGAYGVWAIGWLVHWVDLIQASFKPRPNSVSPIPRLARSPLSNLPQLHLGHIFIGLAMVPALTYYVSWLPYIQVDPGESNFWQLQLETLDYHKRVGGLDAHPYCSLWYSWPLMLRPVAYFYEVTQATQTGLPPVNPPLPSGGKEIIYDVHAMGNPILWWFSTAAVLIFAFLLLLRLWQSISQSVQFASSQASSQVPSQSTAVTGQPQSVSALYTWVMAYLLVNWAANFLPWVRVTRCLFIYHYMESLIFAILLLALLLDRWLGGNRSWQKTAAVTVIGLILIGFVFWLPLYLGLPLSPEALQLRRWLPSWV